MTLLTNLSSVQYLGTGSTGPFAYPFRVTQSAFFFVTTTDLSGNVTQLTYGIDYTVTGIGARNGGSLTLTNALTAGWTLTISRVVPNLQTANFRSQGQILPGNVEDAFDYEMMAIQQLGGGSGQFAAFDEFEQGTDFNAGTSTTITLKQLPAMVGGLTITFDSGAGGIVRHHSKYTVAGRVVTFNAVIPVGVLEIQAQYYGLTNFNQISAGGGGGGGGGTAGPWIDVTAAPYNAKGDGVTDDTASFNAVMTALHTAAGGTLYVPTGKTYRINIDYQNGKGIRMVSNTTLWIERGATLKALAFNGTTGAVVYAAGVANIAIRGGGTIDGDKADHSGGGEDAHCIEMATVLGAVVEDVTLTSAYGDGCNIEGNGSGAPGNECTNIHFRNVIATLNYRNGVSVQLCKVATFTNCQFNNQAGTSPQCGVDLEPEAGGGVVQDIDLVGCHYENNAEAGVRMTGAATNCSIVGGSARANGVAAVEFESAAGVETHNKCVGLTISVSSATAYGILCSFPSNILIANCDISGTFLRGIFIQGGASYSTGRHAISNCYITGDGATASSGIRVENNAGRCNIVGGQIENTSLGLDISNSSWTMCRSVVIRGQLSHGVQFSQGEHCSLVGCFIDSPAGDGILVQSSCLGAHLVGNVVFGAGGAGILLNAVTDAHVVGNKVSSSNQSNGGNVQIRIDTCTNALVEGNTSRKGSLTHVPTYGLYLTGSTGCVVKNNDVTTGGGSGNLLIASDTGSVVEGNLGYNPVGTSGVGVGASPATITNGPTRATLYLTGGTITKATKGGDDITGAGNQSIQLEAYESVVITYSLLPTGFLDVH